jgi:2-oxoglutarate ferredoxin oxidoreductase subunit gamma
MRKEIKLTGSGGQGLILTGVILAEAALIDGKCAIQSQSYGPEARGGFSKAEVIISDEEIDFVKVQKCDMLLCLSQASYDRYGKNFSGVLILDEGINIKYPEPEKVLRIPILSTAAEKLGKPMVANIVALGAVNGVMDFVSKESLLKALINRVPKGTEDLNKLALQSGYDLVRS